MLRPNRQHKAWPARLAAQVMPSKTDVMIDGAGRVCVAFGCVHKYGQSPGYKVIVNGGNCNVFTIFSNFFPHMNEWMFASHEDSMGWDGVPVIDFELTKVVSMRNSSMRSSRNRDHLANDSFVMCTSSFDSQSTQKS